MPNARPHEYDLRRFPSKYAGKCPGCNEWFEVGDKVLWGKPGGEKSVTYHDNPDCVPRNLTFDPSGGVQVPRSHTETPTADVGGGAPGGHAASEPNADSHVGQRLLMAKIDTMNATLRGLQDMIAEQRGMIQSIIAAIEKVPF